MKSKWVRTGICSAVSLAGFVVHVCTLLHVVRKDPMCQMHISSDLHKASKQPGSTGYKREVCDSCLCVYSMFVYTHIYIFLSY